VVVPSQRSNEELHSSLKPSHSSVHCNELIHTKTLAAGVVVASSSSAFGSYSSASSTTSSEEAMKRWCPSQSPSPAPTADANAARERSGSEDEFTIKAASAPPPIKDVVKDQGESAPEARPIKEEQEPEPMQEPRLCPLPSSSSVKEKEKQRERKGGASSSGGQTKKRPLETTGGHELARQVNRFSPEELEYLEHKFIQFPTPNIEQRKEIAKDLSDRRRNSEFESIRGQGWPCELTQVQIKYWFDHQRRKMKKLKMTHSQFTQGVATKQEEKGCVAAFVNSPQMFTAYNPSTIATGTPTPTVMQQQLHKADGLTRVSPTGVLPAPAPGQIQSNPAMVGLALNFGPYQQPRGAVPHPYCMPMMSLPITPPPPPQGTGASSSSTSGTPAPGMPPAGMDLQAYMKYWQTLSMLSQHAGGPAPAANQQVKKVPQAVPSNFQEFKVVSWQPNQIALPRHAELSKGIFVLSGSLRVLYYGSKDDPDDSPTYSVNVAEGSYIGKSMNPSAGGMLIQAQTLCSCALVDH